MLFHDSRSPYTNTTFYTVVNNKPLTQDELERLLSSMPNEEKDVIMNPYEVFEDTPRVPEESGKKVIYIGLIYL